MNPMSCWSSSIGNTFIMHNVNKRYCPKINYGYLRLHSPTGPHVRGNEPGQTCLPRGDSGFNFALKLKSEQTSAV